MLNKVFLQGRLVADPELRQTQSQIPVCNFSIAVEQIVGGEKKTDFFKVVAWKKCAEFVQKYFCKGKPILVEGYLSVSEYTDKSGNPRRSVELTAEKIYFVGDSSASAKEKQFEEISEISEIDAI